RYAALLIDEFQDTDPIQGELLLYLAERAGRSAADWRGLELEPGKLFVVGDPKQSIYRFRGADIRAYEEFTRLMLAQGAAKCDLQTSFRSHAGVVEPVNRVHGALMRPLAGLQPAYLPIQHRRDSGRGAGLELVVARPADGERGSAEESRGAEAAWIARWIAERCGDGKDYRYREVAILLRTTTALGPYLDALKAAGLPYAVEADRSFYDTQEVLDLLNLLRALDDPEDRLSLAGLLRSPLAALDDRELYALKLAGGLDYRKDPPAGALSEGSRARLAGLWRALRGLRASAGLVGLGEFVGSVFRETFLVELASAAYYGEQTASNLLKFARLAAQAGEERGATLKELIGLVERAARESADEGESPLADEQLDAVRILTIHKAKGLEWPVVILPNLGAPPRAGDAPASKVDWSSGTIGLALPKTKAADAAMAFLKRAEALRERHEAVRLLYVAMTRACDHTILLGPRKPAGERSFGALLRQAGAWPAEDASPESLSLGGLRVPVRYVDGPGPAQLPRPGGSGLPGAPKGLPALARAWKERRAGAAAAAAPRATSPTALEAAARWRGPAPASEEAPAPRAGRAKLVGVLCHRVLEGWDFQAGGDAAAAVERACRALRFEQPGDDWEGAAAESRELLAGFLRSEAARELAAAAILGREVPFVFAEEGRIVRGAIDVIYELGGKLWVGDYKTEKPARKGSGAASRHEAQSKAYREAVSRALGRPCGFKLLFLRGGKASAA
ncbi:MAG: UvrD-helicase domain-containing protein, partial [Elusimicrobia bacterium]|nr:UvrD-helicase domain-containing protein [Elusimicrobiota bacterium]